MKKIFLFTNSFPFSKVGEAFIETELLVASELDVEISLVPLYSSTFKKEIPDNINIIYELSNYSLLRKIIVLFKMIINPLFFGLFIHDKKIYRKWKNWYFAIKYLYGAFLIKDFLISNINLIPINSILYSFWLNHTALGFALANECNSHFKTCKLYSRAHRFDLYGDDVGIFIPYREKTLDNLSKVYSGSIDGVKYLKEKYPKNSQKIESSRLGVLPICTNYRYVKKVDLSLISCSNVIPLKRVCLMFKSIKQFCIENSDLNVNWIHIGDGSELSQLKYLVRNEQVENLNANLLGVMSVNEIVKLFEENVFDAFINISLTEGLPVTLMMAISAGVPLIATDAGGNREITTKESGCLLPIYFSQNEFSSALKFCMNNTTLYESSFSFYQKNFSAIKNYREFYYNL